MTSGSGLTANKFGGDHMGQISKSVLADLNRELADLSPSLSHSDTSMAVKQASNALADLRKDLDGYRVSRTLRDLNRELDNFSLPRFDKPLLEVKKSPVGVEIKGYASTFGPPPDDQNEIVDFGAYSKTIEQHRRAGTMPVMLFSHNQNQPIGTWKTMSQDSRGLFVTGTILSTVRKGAEAISLIQNKSMNGLSVGFRCRRDKIIGRVRHLQELDLIEISLCAMPAASGARLMISGKEL
jgi:HK97 family phage prohead protease